MTTSDKSLSQKFEQVSQELRTLMNLLSRIDERVEIFIAKHDQLSDKFDDHIENCPMKSELPDIMARMAVVEKVAIPKNGYWSKQDHQEFSKQISDEISGLKDQIIQLEKNVQKMELTSSKHEGIWKTVGLFIFQVIVYVLGVSLAGALLHFLQIRS